MIKMQTDRKYGYKRKFATLCEYSYVTMMAKESKLG
jgi:hypothetical protein